MLLGYAVRLVGNRDDAEEVVQEAIVSIYASIDRFEGQCSIRSWLFRIVHHKAVDHLRRNSRFVKAPVDSDEPMADYFTKKGSWAQPIFQWENSPEARVNARQMLTIVRQHIDKLPHNYREMLLMREVYKLDTEEICNALQITPVHARVMLHRARQALYKSIDQHLQRNELYQC
jgi:RNA polymerase sigma-70 factor (ECF subfamily)